MIRKKRKKWDGIEITSVIVLTALVVLVLIPFWNTIVISFSTAASYARKPFSWFPEEFTLGNYRYLLTAGDQVVLAYKGTLIVTFWGVILRMLMCTMGAYGFSRSFPGKAFLFKLALFTMFFGGGLIPVYIQIKKMGLIDTYTVIILMSLVSVNNIIIMKNGFESVPMDLQEAAKIDGANDIQIFAQVMLPLQKPLIATFSLFAMVEYWNAYYWPMIFLVSGKRNVLQLYLRNLINSAANIEGELYDIGSFTQTYSSGIKMSAVFVVMLPVMLVYPFLQKYFAKGMLVGAVKM